MSMEEITTFSSNVSSKASPEDPVKNRAHTWSLNYIRQEVINNCKIQYNLIIRVWDYGLGLLGIKKKERQ